MTDLPCPFCGDPDPSVDSITDADVIDAPEEFFLTCAGCGAQGPVAECGPEQDRDEAAERAAGLWNGRVGT